MGTMAKMRGMAPIFILGAGLIFVLFMVVSSSNVLTAIGGRNDIVGSINGEDITYQEFSKAVQNQREQQKAQTGKEIPDDQMDAFRDQVWNALVNQKLIQEQLSKYGITVYDQEIRNIILGKNPPEFLKKSFIDSTGKFNRQAYESAIYDPRNSEQLIKAENVVRQMRMSQKLQSMLLASINISNAELKNAFINRTQKLKAKYALASINSFPDSSVKVTDADLKAYYEDHLDDYSIKPNRKVRYVFFKNIATHEDSERVKNDLTNLKQEIVKGEAKFDKSGEVYSSVPVKSDTLDITKLPADYSSAFLHAKKGEILGPFTTSEGEALYRVDAIIPTNQTWVRASHILINDKNSSDKANYEHAMKIYDEIRKGANFEKLAKEESTDRGSAINGGDLGWYGKNRMVPEFEKKTFSSPVGVLIKPFKTQFGYHIVKVTGRTNDKFAVSRIVESLGPSSSTTDNNYNSAADYSYIAKKNDFDSEAKLMNYKIIESPSFYKESRSVPGIGESKEIVEFAFSNDLNTISDPFKVQGGYVVAQVSDVQGTGVKPFEKVKNQIRPQVIRKKKFEKAMQIMQQVYSKINGDLDKAHDVNNIVSVDTTGTFSPESPIFKVGMDYAFIYEAQKQPIGKVSKPFKGARGVYLMKVLYRTPFDSSKFATQESALREQLYEQKRQTFLSEWITELRKNATIVDNRNKFYTN